MWVKNEYWEWILPAALLHIACRDDLYLGGEVENLENQRSDGLGPRIVGVDAIHTEAQDQVPWLGEKGRVARLPAAQEVAICMPDRTGVSDGVNLLAYLCWHPSHFALEMLMCLDYAW